MHMNDYICAPFLQTEAWDMAVDSPEKYSTV